MKKQRGSNSYFVVLIVAVIVTKSLGVEVPPLGVVAPPAGTLVHDDWVLATHHRCHITGTQSPQLY